MTEGIEEIEAIMPQPMPEPEPAEAQRFPILISPLWRPFLLPFGATPERAFAAIEDNQLHVRFGRLFDHRFPLKAVEGVAPLALARLGGRRLAHQPARHHRPGRHLRQHRGDSFQGATARPPAFPLHLQAAGALPGGAPRLRRRPGPLPARPPGRRACTPAAQGRLAGAARKALHNEA